MRTIILGEEHEEECVLLKRSTQILLRMARQMNLEKQLIVSDQHLQGICKEDVSIFLN